MIESFRPGLIGELGLAPDDVRRANPGLVSCSVTAFGSGRARRPGMPGYDFLLQAMGGLMSVTGEPDGQPLKAGTAVVDLVCGLLAANGIQAALVERARTGVGRHVEVSLMDSALTCLLNQGTAWVAAGVTGRRRGNRHPSIVPYETYATADRPLAIAVGNERIFVRLCEALGLPELPADARFASNEARVEHADELMEAFEARAARAARRALARGPARGQGARGPDQRRRRGVRAGLGAGDGAGRGGRRPALIRPPLRVDGERPADPPRARPASTSTATSCARGSHGLHVGDDSPLVQQRVHEERRRLVLGSSIPGVAKSSAAWMFVDAQVTTVQPPSAAVDGLVHVAGDDAHDLRVGVEQRRRARRGRAAVGRSRPATAGP